MNYIFGVYNGYESIHTHTGGLFYMLNSLRKYNKECKVFILCEKHLINNELNDFCIKMNADIYSDFPSNILLHYNMNARFIIYIDILKKLDTNNINKILLCDMNDLIFQDDPFKININGIYFGPEQSILSDNTNSSSIQNMMWINNAKPYFNFDNNIFNNKPVLCAGTILGTYDGIMHFLNFYSESKLYNYTYDQGILNIYAYLYHNDNIQLHDYSNILTLDKINFNYLQKDSEGFIINKNNVRYNIIHQINRCNLEYMKQLAM